MSGYPENAFTVASADNIDFVHSYARIYCGKQQSSWHGTTVQLVQPQPSTLLDDNQEVLPTINDVSATCAEITTNSDTHMLESRHPCNSAMGTIETRFRVQLSKQSHSSISPLHSPNKCSPIPKRQRQMRTGTEKAGRATLQSIPTTTPRKEYAHQTNVVKPKPTIKDFQLSDKAITDLKLLSTQYVLLKFAYNEQNETILDLQSYFNLSNNLSKPECTNIIYFKVLDQKCNDKETLLNVISALYEESIEQKQKEWILLEGDQATYERLQSIKAQYGNDLA